MASVGTSMAAMIVRWVVTAAAKTARRLAYSFMIESASMKPPATSNTDGSASRSARPILSAGSRVSFCSASDAASAAMTAMIQKAPPNEVRAAGVAASAIARATSPASQIMPAISAAAASATRACVMRPSGRKGPARRDESRREGEASPAFEHDAPGDRLIGEEPVRGVA